MIRITCYLSLTVEIETVTDRQVWSRPLLNLTPLVAQFFEARARVRLVASKLATAVVIAGIGFSALRFAAVGV